MRSLLLTDIHGNIEALDAVLAVVPREAYDRLLVLGDLVGYGASPNEVVDRVRALHPDVLIRGNHDKVASGVESPEHFNFLAAEAARWTFQTLTAENCAYVAGLPAGPCMVDDQVEVCHGTPFDEDIYVFDELDAMGALEASERPICFFGHTHLPIAFVLVGDSIETLVPDPDPQGSARVPILGDGKYLINPGSIGQPRDGDPRAAYGIFDSDRNEVMLYRVAYPVELTQRKITEAGLPESLAHRLTLGR
jgi:diadenosine tetraphosphatase ApaH/serine/threonine PP2A family protein phosphatase